MNPRTMKKNEVITFPLDEFVEINQHRHKVAYRGADDQYLTFTYRRRKEDCDILIPLERIERGDPISLWKFDFRVQNYTIDEAVMQYLDRVWSGKPSMCRN